ncbi:penicillin acylase family protein [Hydrogenophaga intermedia]|uniref:penicillin acylase family protein n=1 Tax=Hydrogenophaga intermedia TaxID=65786 RepID=UPI0020443485|nr:penicillin acylase family protein [Hydrogenophaga intermedia]MCM3566118.1 penicillin acylase family protein [Hydrogenophaga intermedia]
MRWIRRLLAAIGLLLVLAAALAFWYARQTLPVMDGRLQLSGLSAPVQVRRDASDVTHIQAARASDAWMALGYVHAQERGWQLAFNRAVMRGALSEFLGPATLETDKLMRTLGIRLAAQRQLAVLPAGARAAMEAYAAGINAFFATSEQARTPEFLLLGVNPREEAAQGTWWDAADSVGWSIMMALDLGGNWGNEFARLSALQVLDTDALWELFPPYPGEQRAATADLARLYRDLGVYRNGAQKTSQAPGLRPLDPADDLRTRIAQDLRTWTDTFGHAEGKGSNNWVVAGSRTASGKPLLANDPHLGLSAPAIWYFARLQAPDAPGQEGMDVIGATLPGTPFVVLGRTANAAWGFTNTGPDVQDLFLEQINPANASEYRVPSADGQPAWQPFAVRVETIKVKGQPDVTHLVRHTRHGPVLSDAQASHGQVIDTSRFVLSLRWSALEADDGNVAATIAANRAQSVDELITAFADFHAPMQNVVMADRSGRIAYKAAGRVPVRAADNDIRGVAPSPGWEARYDWTGWLPYEQTPQDDGARGWIATANQRIHAADYPHFLTQDWAPPYRQQRIEQLLEQTPKHDMASMRAMQGDLHGAAMLRLLPHLQKARSDHPLAAAALQTLQGFDGQLRADSAAPLVYSAWIDEFTRGVIGGRLGQARFEGMYGKRLFRNAVENILETDNKAWCGDAGCAPASGAALTRALERLQAVHGQEVSAWRWGDAHPAISVHRPMSNVKPLAKFFEVRVPTGGDPFTLNVGQYHLDKADAPYANRHAASLRALYDLANLDRSVYIYQTGQSGNVFSSRYRDMSPEWAANQGRLLSLNPGAWTHTLELQP